uniref:ATP-dependent DNA ligase family profile domain-containing protein n=1 Tax=Brassica campestris TaxID=3711 RepID=M4CJ01_BRACM
MASDSAGATIAGDFPNDDNAEALNLNSTELYSSAVPSSVPTPSLKPPFSPLSIPQSNRIPKTNFTVDFFRSSSSSVAFFLSHFHSDHYSGLSSSWSRGIIFCSHITARLLKQILQVPSQLVFPLPTNQKVIIDGSEVVLIDANHCPGAVQFLFKTNDGSERYIHTGDFRFCDSMRSDPFLSSFVGCDVVFLDTTYCNPKFVFPTQQESVDYVISVIDKIDEESKQMKKKVLFLVATYVVGKEKILIEISKRCNRKIFVEERKMSILNVLGCGEGGMFTEDKEESDVHVVGWNVLGETWPYFRPNFVKMNEVMVERGYDKVVGFVPTGWTYEVKRNKFAVKVKDSMEIHLVPYSEHSNYDELREYIKLLRPKRVIPTVGVDVEKMDSREVYKMQKHFSGLVDEMANKKEFLLGFYRQSDKKSEKDGVDVRENDAPGSDSLVTERLLIELRDSLPAWVSEEQMLDLIKKHAGNPVDIVSNFYECEAEFYKQSCIATSSLENQAVLIDDDGIDLQPIPAKGISSDCQESLKGFALPSKLGLTKGIVSPGKRSKSIGNKSNKKAKKDPKSKPVGPGQSTITKFFDKVLDSGSSSVGVGSETEECNTDEKMVHNDAKETYKEVTDQFIDIVHGSESLREYAASIIDEAKGDINRALDIYYSKPSDVPGEHAGEGGGLSSESNQLTQCPEACSSQENIKTSEKSGHTLNLSEQTSAKEMVDNDYVSLPPEKYKPKEHGWYDGQRAQIHLLLDGTVRIFSRNGDETTSKFPDLVDVIKQFACPAAETFMLDAEVEVCIFVFDIMFFNGEQLLTLPLRERRKCKPYLFLFFSLNSDASFSSSGSYIPKLLGLKEVFPETRPGFLEYAKEITVGTEEASMNNQDTLCRINAFLGEAFQSSCEGIMVKSLDVDAGYCPTKRSDSWLKVKRDYVDGLGDTLDLVPIGAWHGNGRKAGWYSPFLMACYNPETEEFQSVCRVMSGFSDAFYVEMKEFYSEDKILAKKPPYYRTGETPDMWFPAEVVWEIKGADLTVSPVHSAALGLVHPSRGISVRFPRFICKRADRDPEECSTAADIAEMFHAQTRKMNIKSQH